MFALVNVPHVFHRVEDNTRLDDIVHRCRVPVPYVATVVATAGELALFHIAVSIRTAIASILCATKV